MSTRNDKSIRAPRPHSSSEGVAAAVRCAMCWLLLWRSLLATRPPEIRSQHRYARFHRPTRPPSMKAIEPNTEVFGTLSTLTTLDGSISFLLLISAVVLLEGFLYKFEGLSSHLFRLSPHPTPCRMVCWNALRTYHLRHPEGAHGRRSPCFPS